MTRPLAIAAALLAVALAPAAIPLSATAADPMTVVNHPASTRPAYRPMVQAYSRNDNTISVYGLPGCRNWIDGLTAGRNVIGASWRVKGHWSYVWVQADARYFDGTPRYDSWDLYTEIAPDQCIDTSSYVLRWYVVTRRT